MVALKFTHNLIEIDGVPDNLRIAVGEKFTLSVIGAPEGRTYDWFTNNDPVLTEDKTVPNPVGTITYVAAAVGESTVQLQYMEPGKNVPTIDRAYKVTVTSKEAVSAKLNSRGLEPLDAETK